MIGEGFIDHPLKWPTIVFQIVSSVLVFTLGFIFCSYDFRKLTAIIDSDILQWFRTVLESLMTMASLIALLLPAILPILIERALAEPVAEDPILDALYRRLFKMIAHVCGILTCTQDAMPEVEQVFGRMHPRRVWTMAPVHALSHLGYAVMHGVSVFLLALDFLGQVWLNLLPPIWPYM